MFHQDAQNRLVWQEKACPALTYLDMSWKAFKFHIVIMTIIIIVIIIIIQ